MKGKNWLPLLLLGLSGNLNAQVFIDVDAAQRGPKIGDTHYGIFFEDINHAADGGLYAELIRNRSFEDDTEKAAFWSVVPIGGGKLSLLTTGQLNTAQKQALKVEIPEQKGKAVSCYVCNDGFWGINVVKGRTYRLTFWARCDGKYKGNITPVFLDAAQSEPMAKKILSSKILSGKAIKLSNKWKKFEAEITADESCPNAKFALGFDAPGTVCLDMVSLFPPTFKNRENGCRPELAQLLADMKPRFMRFPGGCFVEGQKDERNMFRWKETVGPIETRPGHKNENWGYRTSDGLGYHEFLQLSEDLGATPLYVVNVGIWHGGYRDVSDIDGYVQDALDAIEYANGDISTKYGAMRAQNGHPAPFNMRFMEIGNENYNFHMDSNRDQSYQYPERYRKFYEAIKAKYPYMTLIGNVESWGTDTPSWRNENPVEMVDEHYYRSPAWFAQNFRKYDTYDRSKYKIYVGEYAVTQGFGKTGNLAAALGEAIYMMGMENNADVTVMNSYAPIFVNENNVAWQPDMIRFNASQVMCTPSYYVQKLMANNVGTCVLPVKQVMTETTEVKPYLPTPYQVGVATWGTASSYDDVKVTDGGGQTLFGETCDGTDGWTQVRDTWQTDGGIISQKDERKEGSMAVCKSVINGGKYIYTVRARKNSGREGVMIVFNYTDPQNYCWLNLGGWGNTQHAIEQCVDGAKSSIAEKPGKLETGRWYDIRIEVDGRNMVAYVDGQQVMKGTLPEPPHEIFSSATLDEQTGDIIVKIVNPTNRAETAHVNLANATPTGASIIRLTSAKPYDENTMDNPVNVAPTESALTYRQKMPLDVPAYSLSILRIKCR